MNNNAYKIEVLEEYEVHSIVNVTDLISFVAGIDDEEGPSDLRTNPSQEKGDDDRPLAKGLTTRAMARRIKEDWASFEYTRPKLKFMSACEDLA